VYAFIYVLLLLLVSCTVTKCDHNVVGPKEVIATPPVKEEPVRITYSAKNNILDFNTLAFPGCAGLNIVYDGVDYGFTLLDEHFFLPKDTKNHEIKTKCLNIKGKIIREEVFLVGYTPETKKSGGPGKT